MFNYFKISQPEAIGSIDQMEATIGIFYRNFLNALIMKAWTQCALDVDCMANGCLRCRCCSHTGCHRFDQSALTMIISFFFQYPKSQRYSPAHTISRNTSNTFREYYEIRRRSIFDVIKAFLTG
jgi:hypothetical protein